MKIWIDNTGLHSAGCALQRGARAEVDVRGLLQLATLIVFSDEILLSGFEVDSIAARSQKFVDRLYQLGVPLDALSVSPENQQSYQMACREAAERLAGRLAATFHPNQASIIGLEPSDLPARVSAAQTAFVELTRTEVSKDRLLEIENSALEDKATGVVSYMMAISPKLRAQVRELAAKPEWNELDSYQLNAYIRYHLNTSLAARKEATYSPAIARARLQRKRNESIVARLTTRVDEVVGRLQEVPLSTPSVAHALVSRARGQPESVIEQALIFREKATSLRRHLTRRLRGIDPDSGEGQFHIDQEARAVADVLKRELGLVKSTSLADAVEVSFVVGLPVPKISGNKLVHWVKEQWEGRRVSVLTELSREYIGSLGGAEEYDILNHACREKGG